MSNQTYKNYNVGDLVVFKTHPLLNSFRIKGDSKYVPPVMIIKEVHYENNKKKTHDEVTGNKISEKTKYICVYFDDNRSEFVESTHYYSELKKFDELKIERISSDGKLYDSSQTIIEEINSYGLLSYEFAKIVRFKTKKLEIYKKRSSKKIPLKKGEVVDEKKIKTIIQYVVNYTSPDFILTGYKKNDSTNLFYHNGKKKRVVSDTLIKVKWFNPIKNKYSEQFLPIEFFTDKMKLEKESENSNEQTTKAETTNEEE